MKILKRKINKIRKAISDSIYEEYLKTCKYSGELPLNKEEYEKRLSDRVETDD